MKKSLKVISFLFATLLMVGCGNNDASSSVASDSSTTSSQGDVIHVESVSLDQESVNIYVGDDYTLTATVLPQNATNKNVEWTSSNEEILQVFDGVVTALGTGDAYVTVTTQDGNKTARCDFSIAQKVDDEPIEIVNGLLEAMEAKEYQSEDGTKNLKYRMYAPSSYNESNEYGLLVYFHDEEGKGNDNSSQLQNHNKTIYLEKIISKASYKDKIFIIAPQCPIGENFSNVTDGKIDATESNMMSLVSELIMHMCNTYNINLAKVLVTGVGSGATAVFDAINRNVGLFAGAVAVGGTANVEDYENYALTSIWSFSSSNPVAIDNEDLYSTCDKLESVGAGIIRKEYEGLKDKAYIPAYQNENAFEWLMDQERVNEYYSRVDTSYSNLAAKGSILVSNTNPKGIGNKDLETIRDGRAVVNRTEYTANPASFAWLQYDSYGIISSRDDYFGYTFDKEYEFNKVYFQAGVYFSNSGGWFAEGLRVQYKEGSSWRDIESVCTPAYPVVDQIVNIDMINYYGFDEYELTFNPIVTDGIRIIGKAGGRDYFSSCAELEVYGREANLPPEGTIVYKAPSEYYSQEEIYDKIKGAWVGQMSGVVWGAPTEFSYRGELIPDDQIPNLDTININNAFTQDDLYVEIPFIQALQNEGLDVSVETMGEYFKNTAFPLWHGNDMARTNLLNGIKAPLSGSYIYSSCCEDIDWQIEADFAGMMAPGLVNKAGRMGFDYGHVVGYADGAYGGVFVDTMHAKAYTAENVTSIAVTGVKSVPVGSKYRQVLDDIFECYINDYSFEQCWNSINVKWGDDDRCPREGFGPSAKFNIDAKLNGGYCLMGFLYGRNDFKEMTRLSMKCGQDSDCNPSSVASILGSLYGYEKMPVAFKRNVNFNTEKFSYTNYTLNDCIEVVGDLAKDLLLANGLSVVGDTWQLNKNETITPVELEVWEDMPSFEQTIIQNGLLVKVNISSYYKLGVKGISVDYGDTYTEYGESTQHTYNQAGTYTLTIKVYGNDNTVATREFTLYISTDTNIAGQGTAICSQMNPAGAGARDLNVIIDGVLGRTPSQQYDTYYNYGAPAHEDYFGVTFDQAVSINKVEYYAGAYFENGGWFENVRIEVYDGTDWTTVTLTNTPGYPNSTTQEGAGQEYAKYVFEFNETTCYGVRIIGSAGGKSHFIGCSEFKVFGAN